MNILEAMRDPNLFAPWFLRDPATWAAWRAFLAALFALKMSSEQLAIFKECTGAMRHRSNQQPKLGLCVGAAPARASSLRCAQSSWPASMSIANSSHPVSEEQF